MSAADDGLRFLQHVIDFAEEHVFPGGQCRCGREVDFTVESRLVPSPVGAPASWARRVYILACVHCAHRVEVAAEVVDNYVAAAATPRKPPVDVACYICKNLVPDNTVTVIDGQQHCSPCTEVQKLGPIVGVREGTAIKREIPPCSPPSPLA